MGKPVTAKIYGKCSESQHAQGLGLPRGLDPRSYNGESAAINEMVNGLLGTEA